MATNQQYRYPDASQVTVAAVGSNGTPIPTESILVAGENPSGNLEPLQTDSGGALIVSPLTSASVVTANQGAPNTLGNRWPVELTDGTLTNTFTANGLKVDGSAVTQPVSAASLPLPTGASTSALQTSGNSSLTSILANQTNGTQTTQVSGTLPLPTGAATSANQVTELSRLSGSLVPTAFDEITLTYIPSGNGTGQIGTAVYKLATVTQKTLTLTYDSSNRLIDVVAS